MALLEFVWHEGVSADVYIGLEDKLANSAINTAKTMKLTQLDPLRNPLITRRMTVLSRSQTTTDSEHTSVT